MITNQQLIELSSSDVPDLLCFSHLRWDFVYQRPQHLMSRLNKRFRVFFIEEPLFHQQKDSFKLMETEEGVMVVTPMLNEKDIGVTSVLNRQKILITQLLNRQNIQKFIAWYYTPMALKISSHLNPEVVVYDCMDELSAFKFAPAELKLMEAELFKKAQVVFTGGHSLYEAKKNLHANIFAFPSSIEKQHFEQARKMLAIPADQVGIKGIKIGFYGVIDERFNIKMIEAVADSRPEWQLILVGPVVKIDPADLPRSANIHYLGGKTYRELPLYLSGWDIAMIPFEKNDSTKFISPTKTPEYLAAGKPVISTSITDVVTPYANNGLVYIADTAAEFIQAVETELNKTPDEYDAWLQQVDNFLQYVSWDNCVVQMLKPIDDCLSQTSEQSRERQAFKSVA